MFQHQPKDYVSFTSNTRTINILSSFKTNKHDVSHLEPTAREQQDFPKRLFPAKQRLAP